MTPPALGSWRRGHVKPSGVKLCNWPGCRRPVPQSMWGCKTHWFALPDEIRDRLWRAYRLGDGPNPQWREAHGDALEWIAGIPERAKKSHQVTPLPPEKPPCSS